MRTDNRPEPPSPSRDVVELFDREFNFRTWFDRHTGGYVRSSVLAADGSETGVEPFMASFPHILDVGIMGHCAHGLSGQCAAAGVQCYQSGGHVVMPNMAFADFRELTEQCAGKVHQFALGGRGDPELHEQFADILACARDNGIVPNLTTSGYGLDGDRVRLIKQYCGAAAVSWYRTPQTLQAIHLLVDAGVRTNIHFILSRQTIDEALRIIEGRTLPTGVNRIIFLLFKPVGQGQSADVLAADDPRVQRLFGLLGTEQHYAMAGYDSCCIPALVNHAPGIDPRSYDSCEGGRFSAYVTPDLKLLPCSFDQSGTYARDLRTESIAAAWRSPAFDRFRARLASACPECAERQLCLGGCPLVPEIVLCSRSSRLKSRQDGSDGV